MRKKHLFLLLIGALGLSGCANSVTQFYTKTNPQDLIAAGGPKTCTTPQVVRTSSLKVDLHKAMQNGWEQVGYSAWNGPLEDVREEAVQKAHEVGACLILMSEIQSGSETEEAPMGGGFGMGPYYGGYPYYGYTSYVPYTVPLYNLNILFLVQMQVFSTGLYIAELDNKSRTMIGSNKGVQVILVVNGSSAYAADIIPGDVITQIGGDVLTDYVSYAAAIQSYAGESAVFNINRDGKKLAKSVKILDVY